MFAAGLGACGSTTATRDPFTGRWRPEGAGGGDAIVIKKDADGYLVAMVRQGSTVGLIPARRKGDTITSRWKYSDPTTGRMSWLIESYSWQPDDGSLLMNENGIKLILYRVSYSTAAPSPTPRPSASE